MYRGFRLSGLQFRGDTDRYLEAANDVNDQHEYLVRETLSSYIREGGTIDGSGLQDHWFPQVKSDVFISHSHKDVKLAKELAGWIKCIFGLDAFIDSCVWGYADELLRQIDNKYCFNPEKATYSYEKRNGSTSHIHMMLSTALGMMIDNTECLLFLNTPNSIETTAAVDKTLSPWLFAEISMANIVRIKPREFHRKVITFSESVQRHDEYSRLEISYKVSTASLIDILPQALLDWKRDHESRNGHPLDSLYNVTGCG